MYKIENEFVNSFEKIIPLLIATKPKQTNERPIQTESNSDENIGVTINSIPKSMYINPAIFSLIIITSFISILLIILKIIFITVY